MIVELNEIEFEVEESKLDDWEFLKILKNLETNPLNVIDVGEFLLGSEQNKKLEDSLRKEGRIKASEMMDAYKQLLDQIKTLKNSSSSPSV